MKHKKLIIILCICVGIIALCTILSFTAFRVHAMELHFKTETQVLSGQEEQEYIISSSKVSYSTPVFAVNKRKLTENMEKNNPFLKVVNIETIFPNKLVVHCAEREITYAVEVDHDTYFICDADLKVLQVHQTYDEQYVSTQQNGILLRGLDIINKTAKIGEFLKVEEGSGIASLISNTLSLYNRTVAEQRAMFKEIRIGYERSFYTLQSEIKVTLVTFDDFEVNVLDAETLFAKKMGYILALIPKYCHEANEYNMEFNINPKDLSDIHVKMRLKNIKI